MSTPPNPRREHPSSYFVQDRSNEEEFARLQVQDQILVPFLCKWTRIPDNYETLYQQALVEMQQPAFEAKGGNLLTAWGYK